jgi:hypothetical protein
VQTNIPSSIVSGLKTEWTKRFTHYSPDLWTLSYHLRGTQALDVTATDNEDGSFLVSFVAETSGDTPTPLTPGQFFFQAYVTKIADPTVKVIVDHGRVNVIANLETLETFDGRSRAEVLLEAITAMLEGKATRDQMGYTIGQRTLTRIPIPDLLLLKKEYAGIVEAEHIKARVKKGLPAFENIHIKFQRPR